MDIVAGIIVAMDLYCGVVDKIHIYAIIYLTNKTLFNKLTNKAYENWNTGARNNPDNTQTNKKKLEKMEERV